MARRPYFSGNYGSALGSYDTAAKLIAQSGATQGQMYANMGQQLGGAINSTLEKFREKKKEKESQERAENQFLNIYKGNPESPIFKSLGVQSMDEAKAVAKDISKDPQLVTQAMKFTEFAMKQLDRQEASTVRALQMQQINQNMARQKSADKLAGEEQEKTTNFLNFLAQPGPNQIDPSGLDRNSVLRNIQAGKGATPPARMIPGPSPAEQSVMSPQAKQFIRRARQQNQPIDKVLPMAKQIDQEIAQSQPKAMTPKEEAELKKLNLANRKAELELSNLETPKTDYKAGPTIVEDNIFRALDIIKESPMTTTGMGSYLSSIPGTDAKSLKERLGSIKANIGFDYLQAMREASPTGGALGNVSDKELQGLQSVFGSLEQSLDAKELTYNLNLLNYTYNNVIHGKGNHNVFDPRKGGNSPQQTANTIDPADIQSEIDRKKQMLRDRDLQNKYFNNPNIQNLGNVNQGN